MPYCLFKLANVHRRARADTEWEEGALSGSGQKLPIPWGSWSPQVYTFYQGDWYISKGSEKPDRREHLLGQLSNFWEEWGVLSVAWSLEPAQEVGDK